MSQTPTFKKARHAESMAKRWRKKSLRLRCQAADAERVAEQWLRESIDLFRQADKEKDGWTIDSPLPIQTPPNAGWPGGPYAN